MDILPSTKDDYSLSVIPYSHVIVFAEPRGLVKKKTKTKMSSCPVVAGLSARGCGFERPRGSWFERPRRLDYAPDHVSVVNERGDNALVAADLSARDCGLERREAAGWSARGSWIMRLTMCQL